MNDSVRNMHWQITDELDASARWPAQMRAMTGSLKARTVVTVTADAIRLTL